YTTVGSARRNAQHYPWKHKETTRPVEMRDGKPMKFDPQHTKSVSAPGTETEESAMSKDHNAVADRIQRSFWVVDRGPRPVTRGWGHLIAAIVSVISSTVLITYAWMTLNWVEALGVSVYGVGLVGLFAVSALYHRWPWPTARAVQWWRRADHATISVFIAATYTPMCILA